MFRDSEQTIYPLLVDILSYTSKNQNASETITAPSIQGGLVARRDGGPLRDVEATVTVDDFTEFCFAMAGHPLVQSNGEE